MDFGTVTSLMWSGITNREKDVTTGGFGGGKAMSNKPFKVVFIRGPKKTIEYGHDNKRGAKNRAYALVDLHGGFDRCSMDGPDENGIITVDASWWYRR